jgi:hypothetical protein
MSWLRNWLVSTLNVDVLPPRYLKYVIIVAASIVGGYMYGMSGSWLEAIRWDFTTMFACWILTKIAEPVGLMIVKTLLFILP